MSRLLKLFAWCVVVSTCFVVAVTPTLADSPRPLLVFRSLDAAKENQISGVISWSGNESEILSSEVSVNGKIVSDRKITPYPANSGQAIAFLVDTSESAEASGLIDEFQNWFARWQVSRSSAAAEKQAVAIYGIGASPVMLLEYTTDQEKQNDAVDRLKRGVGVTSQDPTNKTSALWDGIVAATSRFPSSTLNQPRTIVSVSSQGNTSTGGATGALANAELDASSTAFYSTVASNKSLAKLDSISNTTGGLSVSTASGSTTAESLNLFADTIFKKQYSLSISNNYSPQELIEIKVAVGDRTTTGAVSNGQAVWGTASTNIGVVESSGPGFFGNPIFLIIGIAILAAGVIAGAYALANQLFARRSFSDQLEAYLRPSEARENEDEVTEVERNRLVRNVLVQRASETAEKISENRGWTQKIEAALERADVSLKAGEFLFLYVVIVPAAFLLGLAIGKPIFFLGIMVFAILGPAAYLSRKAESRKKKFVEQLPDTLLLMAGSMRAGYSLMQAVEAAAQETPNPIGQELTRVVNEIRLGATVPESFDRMAVRMNSQDISWASMGISIQRDVGGDLSELLESISTTMIARNRLKREINTLTAEGRLSAYVLAALPVVVLIAVQILNPKYISLLFITTIGRVLLFVAFVMMVIGLLWMQKIVRIKV